MDDCRHEEASVQE